MSMLPFNIRLFAENLQNPTISLTKMSCPRMIFVYPCMQQKEAIPKKGHFQFFLDPKGALLQHELKSYFAFSLSFFSCMIHW